MGTYEFKKFKKGSKAFTLFAQKEGENYVGPRVEHNTVSNATSIGVLSPDGQLQFELELSNDAGYEYVFRIFTATFLWTKTMTPPSLSNKCRKTVEYVICYENNISNYKYFGSALGNGDNGTWRKEYGKK